MYNLDNVVRIYFSTISDDTILRRDILYHSFPPQEFTGLFKAYNSQYSDTENRQLYSYIENSIREEGHPFAGMKNRSGLNVFAALEELAEQLLTTEDSETVCIYGHLIRFREITRYVDEDLLVCAYLAMRFKRFSSAPSSFAWHMSIGHNNVQLRRIMEKGISENHFHLYGSAPYFHLMWVYLMNHVGDHMLSRLADEIGQRQRVTRNHYNLAYTEKPFAVRILKAALIRVWIVYYLIGWKRKGYDSEKEYSAENPDELLGEEVWRMLSGDLDISIYYYQIQKMIDYIRQYALLNNMGELSDYALYGVSTGRERDDVYDWFAGERWFMYEVLSDELTGKRLPDECFQWFYAYLSIKQSIRSELLQVNDTVGFENFAIYSRRKGAYRDYDKMIESAVYDSLESGNLQSLEIRITPGNSAAKNAELIMETEKAINRKKKGMSDLCYYVFHFTKSQDEKLPERNCFDGLHCRHYKKRRQLEEQANAIYHFREKYRKPASRVLGIDACSQEIGCRPEVFAPVFRFLSEHVVENVLCEDTVGQLKMTYHVGEDFLDVVDGLRAVDEAVRFLNLQCGDRIGHGTVLGINVRKWYLFKQNTILISQMDYLDNIVWLYHKLSEYRLDGFEDLREKILADFDFYFSQVYMTKQREKWLHYNIHTYYEAWKLRGDEPELYQDGKFDKENLYTREWLVNRRYPEKFENRERREIGTLYYLYHYDRDVREKGAKSVQIYIPAMYVEAVEAVQKAFRRDFGTRGIGIETNPSSNLAISPIQGYDEHPIVQMYNRDITWDKDKLQDCPQLNVSINTDDKGVFHTSLENEYALMACAMEKMRDEKEHPVYNRQMIYQWIDNIREMGNQQSFQDKNYRRGNGRKEKDREERDGEPTGENYVI